MVGRATGVMEMALVEAKSSPPHDPDVLDALEADGHHTAVPLVRAVLDGAVGPLWTRPPVLAVELWDPDIHVRVTEWR